MTLRLQRLARRRPGRVLAVVGLLTALLGASAPFTAWDANPALMTVDGSPELRTYRRYLERFGSDELVVIAFERPDLLEPTGLRFIRELTDALYEIDGVESVASIDTAYDVDFGPFGPFARAIVPEDPAEAPPASALLATLRDLPMTRDALVDDSGTVTAVVVKPRAQSLDGEARADQRALLEEIDAVLGRREFAAATFHLAGSPVFNRELERLNTRDNAVFTPVAVALVAVLLLAALRRAVPVALAMLCVLGSLAWVRGAMTLLGFPLNTTTSLLPPLLMVLAVSVAVHVLTRYLRERGRGLEVAEAVSATEDAVLVPAALAALTTSVGFLSLVVSPIPSVRTFGMFAAFGTVASFVLGGIALPAALRMLRVGAGPLDRNTALERIAVGAASLGIRRPVPVLVVTLCLSVVAAFALSGLRVSTHDGEFFPDDDPLNLAYDFIESRLAGVTPLELIVEAEVAGGLRTPEALGLVSSLQDRLESIPETIRGVSIADWIDLAHRAVEPTADPSATLDREAIERSAFVLQAVAADDLRFWVQDDWRVARISSRSVGLDSAANDRLLLRLESAARELLAGHPGLRVEVTGLVPVFARMEEMLLDSQIRSFSLALACVSLIFVALFRSVQVAALAMLPNLVPILLVLGGMALVGIPLDVVTVMVASVNLGIVVDDTIHVLHAFRREREHLSVEEALLAAARHTGRAVATTSFVLALGFAILTLSDFQPTAHFGGLTALTVALALVADLLFLPALLRIGVRVPGLSETIAGRAT